MNTKIWLMLVVFFIGITNLNAQDLPKANAETESLGLPGDSLDLYAVLDLFQKSKTIEEFEASLNDEKTGINNLDLNLDDSVDFIKVVTQKEGEDFSFVLQVDILKDETQDVGVILVTKNKDKKVAIQMVGDESLYGKNYVIEPKPAAPAITANPAYTGTAVVTSQPATVVVLESEPIVQYVYSPVYVPYYPPYYYGYYPVYYRPYPVISINLYFGRNRHHHNHYRGGHRGGNTVIINNNNNTYNNYSKTRNTSNTVNRNKNKGSYTRNNTSKPSPSSAMKNNKVSNRDSISNSNRKATTGNMKQNTPSRPTNRSNVKPIAPTGNPNIRPSTPINKPNVRPSPQQQNRPKQNRPKQNHRGN